MNILRRLIPFFIVIALALTAYTAATAKPAHDPIALRNDIQIRKVIDTGGGFVRMALDPLTHDLYYMDAKANIYRLDIKPKTASKSTQIYRLADIGGAPYTTGLTFGANGTLYVVSNSSSGNTTQAIIRKGVLKASGLRTWSTLASTVPYPRSGTQFDHVFSGIVVSPDGRYVYVNSGSRTDHGEVESSEGAFPDVREVALTSAIFRIPTDVTNLVLPNNEAELKAKKYLFADGTRNSYDLAFAPNGDLFAGDNGPDADYTEELNWLREGHHYGFPWRLGVDDNPQQFPNYNPSLDHRLPKDYFAIKKGLYHNDPTFPPPRMVFTDPIVNKGPDADEYRELDGSDSNQPISTFTPHRTPLGLTFDTEGTLSKDFKGDAFILSWGPEGGTLTDRGEDLLHLKLTKIGDTYQVYTTQLVRGFDRPIDNVLLNKNLYVLDYGGAGSIWKLTFP